MGSIDDFSRYSFPDDFVFGTSSSAYQYEGETNKHGRGPAIWDTFTEEHTERISDHSNGDVAIDFYHRYKEDVQRMKEMGMDAFRFSISWSRVIPHGRISAGVNEEGIKFYNDLIDDLLENGLQPYVTLFHWDTPQALKYWFLENDFRDFVDLCFKNFGDRVKKWITLNEPWTFNVQGYDLGTMAPGRISVVVNDPHRSLNTGATEVYTVTHHLLLAHAAAVRIYKENEADQTAAKRSLDFMLGWLIEKTSIYKQRRFMDPLTNGDYPRNMHDFVGGRLPKFTTEESEMVKGSYDFIGINYYTTYYAQNIDADYQSVNPDRSQAGVKWLYIYPEGICKLLNYTKDHYRSPPIYITENGVDDVNSSASSLKEALDDPVREKSYKDHLKNVLRSINEHGVDVKGFFAWSLIDNFEWGNVKWFKQFLRRDDSHSPVPHALPLGDEKSKIEDGLARDAKRPRNA
uniref:Beta-glucosidase n=1 Tax=Salix viminalis TaxID=40686 RepID=A0A6N2MJY6_SALVM